ncbi:hypothetical protein Tco_1328359, partial [Tanacetum coccineum]
MKHVMIAPYKEMTWAFDPNNLTLRFSSPSTIEGVLDIDFYDPFLHLTKMVAWIIKFKKDIDETVGDDIVDDDVPKERVKRTNIPRFKITGKRRLYRLIDEDEDDEDIYGHALVLINVNPKTIKYY